MGVSGYIAYNFVLGAYAYWGPKAGYYIYNMVYSFSNCQMIQLLSLLMFLLFFLWQTNADMIFGGITIVCGIFGTLAGGLVLDYMNSTVPNAFKVC